MVLTPPDDMIMMNMCQDAFDGFSYVCSAMEEADNSKEGVKGVIV